MSYQNLQGTVRNDYRYLRDGSYTDRAAAPRPMRRAAKISTVRTGPVCIACKTIRSVTNKCECNS